MKDLPEITILFIKTTFIFILFFFSITILRGVFNSIMGVPPFIYGQRQNTLRIHLTKFYSRLPFLFAFLAVIGAICWPIYTIKFLFFNLKHNAAVPLAAVVLAVYLYYWADISWIISIFSNPMAKELMPRGFSAVGGYEDVKKQIREAMKSALSRNPLKTNGILLYGPQGCGKTFIAEKAAEEFGIRYKKVHIDDIKSMWVNESPIKLGELFRWATARQPYALIFDEIDDLITSRDGRFAHSEDTKVTSAFLTYMDDLRKGNHRVVVFGTTNNYDKLDKASVRRGRFDYHIKINKPSREDAKEIIKLKLAALARAYAVKAPRGIRLANKFINIFLLILPILIFAFICYVFSAHPEFHKFITSTVPGWANNKIRLALVILVSVGVPFALFFVKKGLISSVIKLRENRILRLKGDLGGSGLERLAEHFTGRTSSEIDSAIKMVFRRDIKKLTVDDIISIDSESRKLSRSAVPDVSWDDVIISSGILEEIKRICEFIKNYKAARKKFTKPLKGMILYGEAGTGKTLIAKAIASNTDCSFYHCKISEIQDKYRGGTEKNIERIYEVARANAPSVVFIDEADALFKKRQQGVDSSATNQILGEMEGFDDHYDVVFTILATNRIDDIDEAVKSRVAYMLHIPKPDSRSRERLFELFISKIPHSGEFDCSYLAALTDGFSARDIENLVNRASALGFSRPLEYRDIIEVLEGEKGREKPVLSGGLSWDSLIVSNEVLKQLKAVENIFKHPDKAISMGINTGIHALFYGEAGTGKTHAARIFASLVNADFREYSGGQFRRKWVGETEEMIRDMFKWLRSRPAAVVYIDEADGILMDRNLLTSEHSISCVNQFLSELQGFGELKRSYAVIISTNRLDAVDPAVRSRFPIQIHFGLPGAVERKKLFEMYLGSTKLEGVDIGWLVDITEGQSGRYITNLINTAKMNALSEGRDYLVEEDFKTSPTG